MSHGDNIVRYTNTNADVRKNIYLYKPFICHTLPLVGARSSYTIPFIGYNKPFITYRSKLPNSGQLNILSRYHSGFSLIELMITLVILTVVAGFAIPSFMRTIEDNRITTQANGFVADLNFARSEAIKRASWVAICVANAAGTDCDTTKSSDWKTRQRLIWNDTTVNGLVDAGEEILRVREPIDGNRTSFGDPGGAIYTIGFDRKGMTNLGTITAGASMAVRLAICYDNDNNGIPDANTGRDIVVSYTGTSRVIRPATACVP
jgi:type IV fimbrial biogenesis protein FimT